MLAEKIEFSDNQPFRVKVQKINRYPIHWHDGITEIILSIRGDVEVVTNFEHLTVKEGDFDILLRGISYELSGSILKNFGDRLVYSMIFEFNWLKFLKTNEGILKQS